MTLPLPVRCLISIVPRPSAVASTMAHRHTCFCGVKGASAKIMDPKATNYPLEDGLVQYESEIVHQFPQIPAR